MANAMVALWKVPTDVWSLALTKDGRRLAVGTAAGALFIWDVATRRLLAQDGAAALPALPRSLQEALEALELPTSGRRDSSRDERLVALYARHAAHTVVVDVLEGAPAPGRQPRARTAVALNQDGTRLAAGAETGTLEVWDVETWQIRCRREADRPVRDLRLDAEGRRGLCLLGEELHWWDLETGDRRHVLARVPDGVTAIALAQDGRRAMAAGRDRYLCIWDLDTGECLRRHRFSGNVLVSADGRHALSERVSRGLTLWDVESEQEVAAIDGPLGPFAVTEDVAHLLVVQQARIEMWGLAPVRSTGGLATPAGTLRSITSSEGVFHLAFFGGGAVTVATLPAAEAPRPSVEASPAEDGDADLPGDLRSIIRGLSSADQGYPYDLRLALADAAGDPCHRRLVEVLRARWLRGTDRLLELGPRLTAGEREAQLLGLHRTAAAPDDLCRIALDAVPWQPSAAPALVRWLQADLEKARNAGRTAENPLAEAVSRARYWALGWENAARALYHDRALDLVMEPVDASSALCPRCMRLFAPPSAECPGCGTWLLRRASVLPSRLEDERVLLGCWDFGEDTDAFVAGYRERVRTHVRDTLNPSFEWPD